MKGIFLFAICFVYTQTLLAQKNKKGTIEIHPVVGATYSGISGESTGFIVDRSAFRIGSAIDYFFNHRWSLRTGIFSQGFASELVGSDGFRD